ncbi:MAG: rhomboid family intramembrane serine protease [Candidatus Aminicenantes bacterium]|nr:rhomboid family intramembrane serine protease [Candidatus Aminicenantes bacterium]MDH5715750.1 rhomboid family intramembrane serine protease [Candidatus Aminicenantes bacterium]
MIPLKDENPSFSFPMLTVGIIGANVMVFIYQLSLGEGLPLFIYRMGLVPYEFIRMTDLPPATFIPIPLTLLTSIFLHGGLLHLAGNMLYLWIFGDNIEDSMGHLRFLIFYILCGAIASLLHILVNPNSKVPTIGASGAISGVLGAYLVLYPRARVVTLLFFFYLIRIVRLPAMFFLGVWFLWQLMSAGLGGGGVAWFAHIGGFAGGVALVKLFARRRYPRLEVVH